MKNATISLESLTRLGAKIGRYRVLVFCLAVAAVYGFLVYQIGTLSNRQPDPNTAVSASKTAKVPHIDPQVLKQLESLQDNSVSVTTLFNDARSNPFQE